MTSLKQLNTNYSLFVKPKNIIDTYPNNLYDFHIVNKLSLISTFIENAFFTSNISISMYNTSSFIYNNNIFYNNESTLNIIQIASSFANHILLLNKKGNVLSCGWNSFGQLGLGYINGIGYRNDSVPYLQYVRNSTNTNILQDIAYISNGEKFSMFLLNNGNVLYSGILYNLNSTLPTYLKFNTQTNISNIIKISSSYNHLLLLTIDYNVIAFGENDSGQLGNNTTNYNSSPTYVLNIYGTSILSNIVDIFTGYKTSFFIEITSKVLACGYNYYNQLGINSWTGLYRTGVNSTIPMYTLTSNGILDNIINISSGPSISLFLENTGKLFGVGDKAYLPAPRDLYSSTYDSVEVVCVYLYKNNNILFDNLIDISSGLNIYSVLDNTKKVISWGNVFGKFPSGTLSSTKIPQYHLNYMQILKSYKLKNIYKMVAGTTSDSFGETHTLCLQFNHYSSNVIGFGNNANSQLLYNSNQLQLIYNILSLYEDNLYDGKQVLYPIYISNNTSVIQNIVDIACGNAHSLFLRNDCNVLACGLNDKGQLGNNNTTNQSYPVFVLSTDLSTNLKSIKTISAGSKHSLFLNINNTVLSCGNNNYGQLGLNSATSFISTPNFVVSTSGSGKLTNITNITCGFDCSLFLMSTFNVLGCGYNFYGQLGNNTFTNTSYVTYVKNTTNTGNLQNIINLKSSVYSSFFIENTNKVLACGYNYYGQLGINTNTYVNGIALPLYVLDNTGTKSIENIIQVATAHSHTLFLNKSGTVLSVGNNQYGALGKFNRPNYNNTIIPTYVYDASGTDIISNIIYIEAANHISYFITTENNVLCCGKSGAQRGTLHPYDKILEVPQYVLDINDKIMSSNIFMNISKIISSGTNLRPNPDNSYNGHSYQIFLDDLGKIYFQGYNDYGNLDSSNFEFSYGAIDTNYNVNTYMTEYCNQIYFNDYLSNSNVIIINHPTNYTYIHKNTAYVYGINFELMYGHLLNNQVSLKNVINVAVGYSHSIFLLNTCNVYACGNNLYGQLGTGNNLKCFSPELLKGANSNIFDISCGLYHSMLLNYNNNVFSTGRNDYGQLGINNNTNINTMQFVIDNVTSVKCGQYHTVFLTVNGNVYSCGLNNYGQLGINNTTSCKLPTQVVSLTGSGKITDTVAIDKIQCGKNHTLFLGINSILYGTGNNNNNQLGTNVNIMQYSLKPIITYNKLESTYSKFIALYSNCFTDKTYLRFYSL
jgi:alpha-tubulin suppressor-like RCC1 family protein